MATFIPGAINRLKTALEAHFDALGFAWKVEESQSGHSQGKPVVFPLVCAERNGRNFPKILPSVTVELVRGTLLGEQKKIILEVVCHCAVVNSAIIEREKTVKDGDTWKFLTDDGFTDAGAVEALFADCLLLGEETLYALRDVPGVSDLTLFPPEHIHEFPYCQCQVRAQMTVLPRFDSKMSVFL